MKELLLYMAKNLVDNPEAVTVVETSDEEGKVLETLPLEVYREYSPLFAEDVYKAVDLTACVERRISAGGTGPASVQAQLDYVKQQLQL